MTKSSVRATVRITYNGTLKELSDRLAIALNLKDLSVEASESPPYEDIGTAEAMGFEAWLEADDKESPGKYVLTIESETSFIRRSEARVLDLSPWLARLVMAACGSDVIADPVIGLP